MKIKVTLKHIENGLPCSSSYCPIALAARDSGISDPSVSFNTLSSYYKNGSNINIRKGIMPKKAQTFIKRFDALEEVKPFEFEVKLQKS